jgi:hypothetical protein
MGMIGIIIFFFFLATSSYYLFIALQATNGRRRGWD